MEENATGEAQAIPDNITEKILDNWISILIIAGILITIVIIVRVIASRARKIFAEKISDDRAEIKKRTFTFTSVISNLIIALQRHIIRLSFQSMLSYYLGLK